MAEGSDEEDKTQEPSQRRLDQAIERGDVAKSLELNNLFVLAAGTLIIMIAGPSMSYDLAISMRGYFEHAHEIQMQGDGLRNVWMHGALAALAALALPMAFVILAGVGANMMQHRLLFTLEPLMPQFSRISPMAGAKRIFGKQALVNLGKSLLKIAVVGAVIWIVLKGESNRLDAVERTEVAGILPLMRSVSLKLCGAVLAIYAFLAMGDYVYQRYTWYQRQRMTREEMKQEFKETEGNPEIKAKIAQMRRSRARKRMMANVPKAAVIITNPTHYAIALQYEPGMAAPICVAKGVDELARRIREVANEHNVPIIQNPPLARALHKSVEIDDEVPEEHYKAVAEVIGLVMRLRRRRA